LLLDEQPDEAQEPLARVLLQGEWLESALLPDGLQVPEPVGPTVCLLPDVQQVGRDEPQDAGLALSKHGRAADQCLDELRDARPLAALDVLREARRHVALLRAGPVDEQAWAWAPVRGGQC
jgi:hypothetical protein